MEIKVGDRVMRKVWQGGDKDEHTVASIWSIGLPHRFFATLEDGSSCSVDSLLLINKDPQQDFLEGDVWANEDKSQVFKIISIYEKEPSMGASKKFRKRIGCLSLKDGQEYVKGELVEFHANDMKRLLPNLLHRESSEQDTCAWFLVEHSPEEHTYNSEDYWVTDCGKTHHDVFGPNGPVEEEYTHCPRCGRKLERTYRN